MSHMTEEKSWAQCLPEYPSAIPLSTYMSSLTTLTLPTLPSTCHLDLPFRSPRTPKASITLTPQGISQDIIFLKSLISLTTLRVLPACGVYWKQEHVEAMPDTLTSLSLNHTSVPADSLLLIPSSCPSLRHLSLRHTCTLDDTILAQLLPHMHLTSLDISHCDGITNITPIIQTHHVTSLTSLSIAHTQCDDTTLIAMREAHMNERIIQLSLSGCQITTAGIRTYLTSPRPSPLTHLNLSGCSALDDDAISMVASTCGDLLWLDIAGIDGITDEAVILLSAGCHKLSRLRHFDCDISDDSLFILMKANPKIRLINTMRRLDDEEFMDYEPSQQGSDDEGSGDEQGDDEDEEEEQEEREEEKEHPLTNGDDHDDWDRHLSELRLRSESIRLPARPQ